MTLRAAHAVVVRAQLPLDQQKWWALAVERALRSLADEPVSARYQSAEAVPLFPWLAEEVADDKRCQGCGCLHPAEVRPYCREACIMHASARFVDPQRDPSPQCIMFLRGRTGFMRFS